MAKPEIAITGAPRIYLAGPDVFCRDAFDLGHQKKALCEIYGFEGIFPFDVEVEIGSLSRYDAGMYISEANENLIRSCTILIANVTPFRSPSTDVGTAYEMGFAKACGLRIYAYSNTTASYVERIEKSGYQLFTDDFGVNQDQNDMAVEQWDMFDNLMLEGAIKSSGGGLS